MDVSMIQLQGAPSTGMDRKGVPGNIDSLLGMGAGFETSLLAMLGMPVSGNPGESADDAVGIALGNLNAQAGKASPLFQNLPGSENPQKSKLINLMQVGKKDVSQQLGLKAANIPLEQTDLPLEGKVEKISLEDLKKLGLQVNKDVSELPAQKASVQMAVDLAKQPANKTAVQVGQMYQAILKKQNAGSIAERNMDVRSIGKLSSEAPVWTLHKDEVLSEGLPQGLKGTMKGEEKLESSFGLKNLADSLYIHKHIGGDLKLSRFEMPSEASQDFSLSSSIRENLVEDMKAFVSKIIETKEGGAMSLKLRPGQMGEVEVRVEVQSDSVRIHMDAESTAAERILKSQSAELKQQLQGLGLKLDELQISSQRAMDHSANQREGRGQNAFSHQQQQQSKQESDKAFFMDEPLMSEDGEG